MTAKNRTEKSRPKLDKGKVFKSRGTTAPAGLTSACGANISTAGGRETSAKLTPDEQMALYEKCLKENDGGHQPC